ncbi:MAG: hypothetical protein ACI9XU_001349, partial [Arenicella sp.]
RAILALKRLKEKAFGLNYSKMSMFYNLDANLGSMACSRCWIVSKIAIV